VVCTQTTALVFQCSVARVTDVLMTIVWSANVDITTTIQGCHGLTSVPSAHKTVMEDYLLIGKEQFPYRTVLPVSFCLPFLSSFNRQCPQGELLWWPIVLHPSSVRPCLRASTISLNNFSSETAHWILTKLHRNDPRVVPYQRCSKCSSWLLKLVTGAKT